MTRTAPIALATFALVGCGGAHEPRPGSTTAAPATSTPQPKFAVSKVELPGGGPDGVLMDYLLYDPRTAAVWAPAGNTGSVDVIDTKTGKLARIEGFATQEMERKGKKRTVGPSSATLGPAGTVYVGSRGDFTVCAIDESKLTRGTCGKLDAMPDGIAYVTTTDEVWVTTPRDKSLRILDGKTLQQKARLAYDGEPEGFAPDVAHGRFYTNLEDKDLTLAIDIKSHETVATWKPNCGEDGPHGLRLVEDRGLLVVACSTRVEVLDTNKDGAVVGSIDVGDGIDDVDYSPSEHAVYAGAAKTANLTVATVEQNGALTLRANVATAEGARNGVVTPTGTVYLAHSKGNELVVVAPQR
jgi:DNA-binding beta-propeller fold protein YncE